MKNQFLRTAIMAGALFFGIANSQSSDPGFHSHDGFYLSLSGGVGGMSWVDDESPGKTEMSGGTGNLDVKIGGAIWRDRLILSGDLIGAHTPNPKVKENGVSVDSNSSIRMGMLGLGITYYFMPVNIFLSGTIGAGKFTEVFGGIRQTSDAGFGFQLKAGKEWWVSRDWGLGVSAVLFHLGVPSQSNIAGASESLTGNSLGILFNSTFN